MLIWLIVIAITTAAAIAILHWLPWNRWLGHELQPPWNYAVGVGALLLNFTAWVLCAGAFVFPQQPWMAAVGMCVIAASGGAADWIAYRIDKRAGDRLYRRVFGGCDCDESERTKRD